MIETILSGVLAGAAWSFVGYGEKKILEEQTFDFKKFLETLFTGAFLGFFVGLFGIDPQTAREFVVQGSLMVSGVPIFKKIYNVVKKWISK